jgi:citrate lyase beta subunit
MTDQPTPPATQPSQDEQRRIEQAIQGALLGPTPKLYANAFGFAQTAADISIVAMMNGQPVGVLMVPYVTAKSLVHDLSQIVERYERATGQRVKLIGELNSDLSKSPQGSDSGDPAMVSR